MIYIMLYIAVLIAALVWVGVIVARQPRVSTTNDTHEGADWLFAESTLSDTQYSGLSFNSYHIDHGD